MKPRPSDEEFEELRRKRNAAMREMQERFCKEMGWEITHTKIHASRASDICYCDCPGGPCQHIWDAKQYEDDNMISNTCSRCGAIAAYHDMRCGP